MKLFKARTKEYEFFNRQGQHIGVKAYLNLAFSHIIEDYLHYQEQHDNYYGLGNLANLVDEEMAQRYDSAILKLRITIERTDAKNKATWKELKIRCEICKRGLDAMQKYVQDNHLFTPPTMLTCKRADDKTFAVVQFPDDAAWVKNNQGEVDVVYTMREIVTILEDYELTSKLKSRLDKHGFDKSEVVSINKPNDDKDYYNDKIPF